MNIRLNSLAFQAAPPPPLLTSRLVLITELANDRKWLFIEPCYKTPIDSIFGATAVDSNANQRWVG